MTKPLDRITVEPVVPAPTELLVRIPWALAKQLYTELNELWADRGPVNRPAAAVFLDEIEAVLDRQSGVTKVGEVRAS